jgi:predicted transcriptional regulator
MTEVDGKVYGKKLERIIGLLQHLLAIELAKHGVTQKDIGKHLGLAKATVGKMLKGIKKVGE